MSVTGLTGARVNGQFEVTAANTLTSGSSDSDAIAIHTAGTISASGTADLLFQRTNFFLNDVGTAAAPSTSALSYNGDDNSRTVTTRKLRLQDCQIVYKTTTRRDVFLSEMTRSNFIQVDATKHSFIYTQPTAILDNCTFYGHNTWEPAGQPDILNNVLIDTATDGYLNWEAGRLDFLGFDVNNVSGSHARFGLGNSGNNSGYHWNNKSGFDNTKIRLQSTDSLYFEGISASFEFVDKLSNNAVEDVLVILSSNKSGSKTELGRYETNSSGYLTGTYDTRLETTGADQQRETLFLFTTYSDQAGSDHSSGGGNTYSLTTVDNYLEVRSFGYNRDANYDGDTLLPFSVQQGILNSDYSLGEAKAFNLDPDTSLTATTQATVDAYTTLETPQKLYDRAKSEWSKTANDGYPYPEREATEVTFDGDDVVIDGTAVSVYSYTPTTLTFKTTTYTGSITTTGTVTTQNGALVTAGTFNDLNLTEVQNLSNVAITGTLDFSVAGTYNITNDVVRTINEVTNSSGGNVTLNIDLNTTITLNTGPNITINAAVVTGDVDVIGMPTAGNEIRLQVSNETAAVAAVWQATTVYGGKSKALRTTGVGTENTAGLYFVATTGGTSGGSEPTWDTTVGNTTVDGSVTWTCFAILYYDDDPVSATYNSTYVEGEEFDIGDTYRVRFAELNGATSFKTYENIGTVGSGGFTVNVLEEADSVYALNAKDGSDPSITGKFSPDYTNNEIDLDTNQDYEGTEYYAYYCYEITTSAGMYFVTGAFTALDVANYRNNTSIFAIYLDETAGFVRQLDSVRIFNDLGTRPARDPTTGGAGVEVNWQNPTYGYDGGGGGYTTSDRARDEGTKTNTDNTITKIDDIQGAGFDTNTDSLKEISDTIATLPTTSGDATLANQTTILANQAAIDTKLDTKSSQVSVDTKASQSSVDLVTDDLALTSVKVITEITEGENYTEATNSANKTIVKSGTTTTVTPV